MQSQHVHWAREVAYQRRVRRLGAKVAESYWVELSFLHPLPDPLPDSDRRSRSGSPKMVSVGWDMS